MRMLLWKCRSQAMSSLTPRVAEPHTLSLYLSRYARQCNLVPTSLDNAKSKILYLSDQFQLTCVKRLDRHIESRSHRVHITIPCTIHLKITLSMHADVDDSDAAFATHVGRR